MRALFVFILLSVTLSFWGCAARLDDIDDKVTDLQKRAALLEQKSGMPIGSDRELLEGQRLADMRTQVAAIRNEITVFSGRLESIEFENKSLGSQVKELSSQLASAEREIKALKGGAAPAAAASTDEELKGPEADYNNALKAHQDGEFEKAEKLFSTFVYKYPRNDLTDNALFWMGEGFMARKMYKNAITKFQDLMDRFPKSDMKCEAMANQISCLKQLGMEKEAAAFTKVRSAECPNK